MRRVSRQFYFQYADSRVIQITAALSAIDKPLCAFDPEKGTVRPQYR
jgi:hypothetical protein